jgi:hypothetical protein
MRRIHLVAAVGVATLALTACAHKKQARACPAVEPNDIVQAQLKSVDQAIERAFGKAYLKQGLTQHATPPVRDARGRLVWTFYDIHPIEPEPPAEARRKLTVVLDPCSRKLLDSYVPKT